ncbi:hypothetical protein M513_02497 [Trichuris suis]|uniref:Secreted protein n=1 Tax=Trichuris suis TaxID=68888 RepID=A0A085MHX4_9BILA|nr:hypothetical protein M513_02497 [Trichuris suis]
MHQLMLIRLAAFLSATLRSRTIALTMTLLETSQAQAIAENFFGSALQAHIEKARTQLRLTLSVLTDTAFNHS